MSVDHRRSNRTPLTRAKFRAYAAFAAVSPAAGFGDPEISLGATAPSFIRGRFFSARGSCYGGSRGETYGSAGVLESRFANPARSVTLSFGDEVTAPSIQSLGVCHD
jgi:hypothetical protein